MQKSSLLGVALALCLGACTIQTVTDTDGGTSSSTTDGGTSSNTDGGSSGDGGSSSTSSDTGSVTVSQTTVKAGGQKIVSYVASASFAKASGAATANYCTSTKDGACTVTICDLTKLPQGQNTDTTKPENAGDIGITGGKVELTLSPLDNGTYGPKTGTASIFDGGETLKVSAKGDKIAAFEGSVKAPPTVDVTKPTLPDLGQKLSVDSAQALDLEWTGGTDGANITVLVATATTEKSESVTCTFDAKAGSGTVPATALAKLTKGDGTYSVSSGASSSVKSSGYSIAIRATSMSASGQATIQ